MKVFFADTFFWIAITNPKDAAHQAALALLADAERPLLITTDEV